MVRGRFRRGGKASLDRTGDRDRGFGGSNFLPWDEFSFFEFAVPLINAEVATVRPGLTNCCVVNLCWLFKDSVGMSAQDNIDFGAEFGKFLVLAVADVGKGDHEVNLGSKSLGGLLGGSD